MPDECAVVRAVNPELLYRPRWEPCPEQPEGCLRQVHAWPRFLSEVGWHDGAQGYVYMGLSGIAVNAIVALETGTIAAWSAPSGDLGEVCLIQVAIGDGYAAMYAHYYNDGNHDLSLDQIYHDPLSEIGRETEPMAVRPGSFASSFPQFLSVSRTLVAAEIQPGAFVYAFAEGRDGVLWSMEVNGIPQRVHAVGDFAFWLDYAGRPAIAYASLDQPAAIFHEADPAEVRGFHVDAGDMAWVESAGGVYELWTAPTVFDPAELEPRHVRRIPTYSSTTMGGGWYAWMNRDDDLLHEHIEMVELATGRMKRWSAPEGLRISRRPIYITETEMLLHARDGLGELLVRLDPQTIPWVE